MKRLFLVDYENVSLYSLYGVSYLPKEDYCKIKIFYSENTDVSAIQDVLKLCNCENIYFEFIRLQFSGKNALDFMIATAVGLYALEYDEIYSVSKDKGYQPVHDMLKYYEGDSVIAKFKLVPNIFAVYAYMGHEGSVEEQLAVTKEPDTEGVPEKEATEGASGKAKPESDTEEGLKDGIDNGAESEGLTEKRGISNLTIKDKLREANIPYKYDAQIIAVFRQKKSMGYVRERARIIMGKKQKAYINSIVDIYFELFIKD